MSFMRGNAVTKIRLLVKAGVIDKPAWLDALERAPPLPIPKVKGKVPRLVLDEDPYVQSYYSRFPRSKYLEPYRVNSFDPPLARVFAWRQMELMEKGLSRKEARDKADEEILPLQEEEAQEVLAQYTETASGFRKTEELDEGGEDLAGEGEVSDESDRTSDDEVEEQLEDLDEDDFISDLFHEDFNNIKKGLIEQALQSDA